MGLLFITINNKFSWLMIKTHLDQQGIALCNVVLQSKHYLQGLVRTPKKNMKRMAEVVPDSCKQALAISFKFMMEGR